MNVYNKAIEQQFIMDNRYGEYGQWENGDLWQGKGDQVNIGMVLEKCTEGLQFYFKQWCIAK